LETNPKNKNTESSEVTVQSLPEIKFDALPPSISKAVSHAKWEKLTPVQAHSIPYLLAKKDLMAQARTGSGKTGAFILPMLETLDRNKKKTQALVLVPTRELAKQVSDEAAMLFHDSGLEGIAVYGGVGYGPQLDGFKRGVELVVGTPGRVLDHLIKGNLKLDHLKMLIFDEADRMLGMGFYPDMLDIKSYLPNANVGGYMFSATFPPNVQRLAKGFLNNAEFISLSQDHVHVTDVSHIAMEVPRMDKDRALVRLIEIENPTQALIFCNTKARVAYVATVLKRFGYNAGELSSDLSQSAREKVLQKLQKGQVRFLVATDVAARGIDIPELSHVIQYEVPEDAELYIHRAGRTGRAGKGGVAISLITNLERRDLNKVASIFKIEFSEATAPTDEDVASIVSQRLTAHLEGQLRGRDKLKSERMRRFRTLARDLAESDAGTQLLAMLLDDTYHHETHGAIPDTAPKAKPPSQSKKPNSYSNRPKGNRKSDHRRPKRN
jgi:ATP-dependent RNA helicase DeaD